MSDRLRELKTETGRELLEVFSKNRKSLQRISDDIRRIPDAVVINGCKIAMNQISRALDQVDAHFIAAMKAVVESHGTPEDS